MTEWHLPITTNCPFCGKGLHIKNGMAIKPFDELRIIEFPESPAEKDIERYLEEMEAVSPSCKVLPKFRSRRGLIRNWCYAVRRAGFCRQDDKWCLGFFNQLKERVGRIVAGGEKNSRFYGIFQNQIKQFIHSDKMHGAVKEWDRKAEVKQ